MNKFANEINNFMKSKPLIHFILLIMFASCDNRPQQQTKTDDALDVLQAEDDPYSLSERKAHNDLVEKIYKELVSKNLDLKDIEDQIANLKRSQGDSSQQFEIFDAKNQSYFISANRQIAQISDSLLRDKMKLLIADNMAKYNLSVASHRDLSKMIQTNQLTLSDLHNILKIVRTLPIIEQYQKKSLPETRPLEGYIELQEKTIKLADSLAKK